MAFPLWVNFKDVMQKTQKVACCMWNRAEDEHSLRYKFSVIFVSSMFNTLWTTGCALSPLS
jgi:hypothetical protein